MKYFFIGLMTAAVCLAFVRVGWVAAHREVAVECQLQGSFYVDKWVFECSEATDD